jgi:general secretion pathway protein G
MVSLHSSPRNTGFTLIELLVVLTILATLLTLALPRYLAGVDVSKEVVLKHNLKETRETIDKFRADTGRFPESLQELVDRRYLRDLPLDPLTESSATWRLLPPPFGEKGAVYDLKSGATGSDAHGSSYADW